MTAGPTADGRVVRRSARRRHRIQALIGASLAAVVLAVTGVVVLSGGGNDHRAAAPTPAKSAPTTSTLPAAPTTTNPPETMIATTKVANLQVFDAPDSTKVVTTLSARTSYAVVRTLLVTDEQPGWLKTLLPIRPNGSTGWVRESDVSVSMTPYKITVSLADHQLVLFKDGQQVLETSVVIGRPNTPTPTGTFYVTDPIDLRAAPNSAYGAYAVGLSGYSNVLFEFNGGPGQIALHGTPTPGDVGRDLSNGCVRMPNDVIVQIATTVPLGTPVVIS